MKETMIREITEALQNINSEEALAAIQSLTKLAERREAPAQTSEDRATKGVFEIYRVYPSELLEAAGVDSKGQDGEELRATVYFDKDAGLIAQQLKQATGYEHLIRKA